MARFIGVDMGAESLKVVELVREGAALEVRRRALAEHLKQPGRRLLEILDGWGWDGIAGAAVTGRLGRQVQLARVPVKRALVAGHRFLHGEEPATVVSIGAHGFSVLELRGHAQEVFRENSRCAQGTGNFLRQLVERFGLRVDEAAQLADGIDAPAPLSGRCPVILKTDMTHLANKGEAKDRILAGLIDAICENVQVLVKPRLSPPRVFLSGGVARAARVRRHFRAFLERHAMELIETDPEDGLYLEAIGCALGAAEHAGTRVPPLSDLMLPSLETTLEKLPPLSAALPGVRRLPRASPCPGNGASGDGAPLDLVLGFDIGSTGSKAVALDLGTRQPVWQAYLRTNGSPVGAAQELVRRFLASPAAANRVRGFGATGSGREIVGSLLATVYGRDAVHVMNEIAAHATGALQLDPRVDTIFEIGGQDAKYIRLSGGRVVDAAMNEACSAGTGSFIEEQGLRFEGVECVAQLGEEALAAEGGVALGQHCSVFMAEIIDEALAAGVARDQIVAGIYDSVVANYLNRVKGSRSVGHVVFCQGMPFASDALAAAVARQTGAEVIVPPEPGLMGAIGIALLAADELPSSPREGESAPGLDCALVLGARVEGKDQFVCTSTKGCGGAGNRCRIDRLTTEVAGARQGFTWGGGCSLWDRGTRRRKLPDLAPDPFRERAELVAGVVERLPRRGGGRPVVAMADEFQLKGLLPFFATFVHALGLDVAVFAGGDRKALKRGIEEANVPFCAPMQQYHGLVSDMAATDPDFLFVPMLREIPRVSERERVSSVCPIAQAAPDMLRLDLGAEAPRIVSPVFDMGPGFLESDRFLEGCRALARDLGQPSPRAWKAAWRAARVEQRRFDEALLELGRRAIAFCTERGVTPIVVLGRGYTIHNDVLNSHVPAIVREQGAIAIPVDCYPVPEDAPIFEDVFWGYGQRLLRAAWHLRRQEGIYSIFCSNYSCGPDSFTVHAYAWLMEGRPFAIIETDGHAGDAGTKTRVEAFLHCAREDQRCVGRPARSEERLTVVPRSMLDLARGAERVLVPRMGPEAHAVAAALRGVGARAETLPLPTRETLRIGRRHTSGKECLPLTVTVGSLLERIERPDARGDRFVFLMPGSNGPCRFGAYKQLHQLVLERLGHGDRVKLWSPPFDDYFEGMPPGFKCVIFSGVCAAGVLEQALHDVRPVETRDGAARSIHGRWTDRLWALIEEKTSGDLSAARALAELASGRVYGIPRLVREAALELASVKSQREVPNVLVVGEIYVRSDPFANDFVSEALERRGIRARLEPVSEFVQYADHVSLKNGVRSGAVDRVEAVFRSRIQELCHEAAAGLLGWGHHATVPTVLRAAAPYLREELEVESVLTLGLPLHAWRNGEIDAVISVGPLECMPNKIAEAQFHHVAEREGLLSVTLSLNGDPIDPEVLDGFAFEVHQRFRERRRSGAASPSWAGKLEGLLEPAAVPAAEE